MRPVTCEPIMSRIPPILPRCGTTSRKVATRIPSWPISSDPPTFTESASSGPPTLLP